jgi:hypothetical protein
MNEDFKRSGWRTAINAMECCCGMIANDTKWRRAGNPMKKKEKRGNRKMRHGEVLRNDRKRYQLAEGKGAPPKKRKQKPKPKKQGEEREKGAQTKVW